MLEGKVLHETGESEFQWKLHTFRITWEKLTGVYVF